MKGRQFVFLMLMVLWGLNLEAQVVKLPFRELYLDGKLIYGDSLALSVKKLNVYCCDTNGLKIDSCKSLFYFKYKKFTWIVDATHFNDSNKYSKFAIESIKMIKWNGFIRHPKRYQSLSYYSSRSTAWYSLVIKEGEMRVFHVF